MQDFFEAGTLYLSLLYGLPFAFYDEGSECITEQNLRDQENFEQLFSKSFVVKAVKCFAHEKTRTLSTE